MRSERRKHWWLKVFNGFIILIGVSFSTNAQNSERWLKQNEAPASVTKFALHDVTLQDGVFKQHMERNATYMLKLDADRLLHWHRKIIGLQPKGVPYGGWESMGSIALGHYLSACAMQFDATADVRFKKRVDYIVDELALCQQAAGNGALYGWSYMPAAFERIVKGDIQYKLEGPEFPFMNGGNPYYTIHKDMAGLRDAYLYANNVKAKELLQKFSDWVGLMVTALDEKTFQQTLDVEHGGMSEVLADVYAITGNEKYLDLAKRFEHKRVTDPIAANEDILWPHHANAQVPKFVGYERIYELTGTKSAYEHTISKNFYNMVLNDHTFVIGGNSEYERFGPPKQISKRIGVSSAETCNTYNMLKLAGQLYSKEGLSSYMDYYERALYNHILASHDNNGNFTYYVSLQPNHFKSFSTDFNSFWCCVGSGMENHTKYGDAIYAHNDKDVFLNLFIPSTLTWKEKGFVISQKTSFPESNVVDLAVVKNTKAVHLRIRKPVWADGKVVVKINGKLQGDEKIENGYIVLSGDLKKGDRIELTLPMKLHVERAADNENIGAILYGPIVLAGTFGQSTAPASAIHVEDMWTNSNRFAGGNIPALVKDFTNLGDWIKPVKGNSIEFKIDGLDSCHLVPFHSIVDQRYTVYWDMFTPNQWATYNQKRNTTIVDEVKIGDVDNERNHQFVGVDSRLETNALRSYRTTKGGTSVSYALNTKENKSLYLDITFWGSAWVKNPKGIIEILVDGEQIASFDTSNKDHQTVFYEQPFLIPASMLINKKSINVSFRFLGDVIEGGIYHVKLCTPEGLTLPDLLTSK